jgi:hypothetical protein
MKPVVKRATPAAIAVLRQATALWPKRKKASDGFCLRQHILNKVLTQITIQG